MRSASAGGVAGAAAAPSRWDDGVVGSAGMSRDATDGDAPWLLGAGVGNPHAVLAVSPSGAVQSSFDDEHVRPQRRPLSTGHAFTLHHGDRIVIDGATPRLPLAPRARWEPCGGRCVRGRRQRATIAPPAGAMATQRGALAFRLEARSLLRHADAELLDVTGLRLHELHQLRRAGMMPRTMRRRAAARLVPGAAEDGAPGCRYAYGHADGGGDAGASEAAAGARAAARPGSRCGAAAAAPAAPATAVVAAVGGRSRSASPPALTPPSMGLASAARRRWWTRRRPRGRDVALSEVPCFASTSSKAWKRPRRTRRNSPSQKKTRRGSFGEPVGARGAAVSQRLSAMAEELAATRCAARAGQSSTRRPLPRRDKAVREVRAASRRRCSAASAAVTTSSRSGSSSRRMRTRRPLRLANRDPLSHPTPLPLPAPHASPPQAAAPDRRRPPFEVMSDAGDSGSWDACDARGRRDARPCAAGGVAGRWRRANRLAPRGRSHRRRQCHDRVAGAARQVSNAQKRPAASWWGIGAVQGVLRRRGALAAAARPACTEPARG